MLRPLRHKGLSNAISESLLINRNCHLFLVRIILLFERWLTFVLFLQGFLSNQNFSDACNIPGYFYSY